jgi:antitoxin ParD1/3/4
MLIALTPEQEAWLQSYVAKGAFASIEEAARQLIDERIAERELEEEDLAWAKPLWTKGWPLLSAASASPLKSTRRATPPGLLR